MNAVKLPVPYKSQLDNVVNPKGACNVTCVAMCLSFFGVEAIAKNVQLEDELYERMVRKGLDRHSPADLADIINDYGRRDVFTIHGSRSAINLTAGKSLGVFRGDVSERKRGVPRINHSLG
jgi:hypothetical protein